MESTDFAAVRLTNRGIGHQLDVRPYMYSCGLGDHTTMVPSGDRKEQDRGVDYDVPSAIAQTDLPLTQCKTLTLSTNKTSEMPYVSDMAGDHRDYHHTVSVGRCSAWAMLSAAQRVPSLPSATIA